MNYKNEIKRLAEKHKIEIKEPWREEDLTYVEAFAPHGWNFEDDSLHALLGIGRNATDAWKDLWQRLTRGSLPMEECTMKCDCYSVEHKNSDGTWVRKGYPYRDATESEYREMRTAWGFSA